MKHIIFILMCFSFTIFAQGVPFTMNHDLLMSRAEINAQLDENIETEVQALDGMNVPQKSIGLAVAFSAVVPGSGQLYSGSYWKAALFVAAEAVGWSINVRNNNKGDDQTTVFEAYGDENWSEPRYWSYVYDQLNGQTEVAPNFPHGQYDSQISFDHAGRPVIADWQSARQEFEPFATTQYLSGFSHHLPATKTQQYYEMIGKYPEQFGNAWEDANFTAVYRGNYGTGNGFITEMNDSYAGMRAKANDYYNSAGVGSMVILVNHLVSAIDAGFTARSFNRRQVKLTYQGKNYFGEYVDMVGLSMAF